MINALELRDLAKESSFIPIIKEYRMATGVGLKEAKEAVETCQISYTNLNKRIFDFEKLLVLFEGHLTPYPASPASPASPADSMINATQICIDNWEKIGYDNPYDMIIETMHRLRDNE